MTDTKGSLGWNEGEYAQAEAFFTDLAPVLERHRVEIMGDLTILMPGIHVVHGGGFSSQTAEGLRFDIGMARLGFKKRED